MNVEEFVKEALTQVARGTIAAAQDLQDNHFSVLVNPTGWDHMNNIEFDIAVTVGSSTTGAGEIGLRVFGMGSAGGKGEVAHTRSEVSRIRFAIPIKLPSPNQIGSPVPE